MINDKKKSKNTCCIIKPDVIAKGQEWLVLDIMGKNGFNAEIITIRQLTTSQAEALYTEHSEKSFFGELCEFITVVPVIISVIGHESFESQDICVVEAFRKLIGDTNPIKAEFGTIRKMFGTGIMTNAIHGSDSIEAFEREKKILITEE